VSLAIIKWRISTELAFALSSPPLSSLAAATAAAAAESFSDGEGNGLLGAEEEEMNLTNLFVRALSESDELRLMIPASVRKQGWAAAMTNP